MTGRVQYFSDAKGHGKILGEDGVLYFVHYTKILGWPKIRVTLEENERVTFEPSTNDRGGLALSVERG